MVPGGWRGDVSLGMPQCKFGLIFCGFRKELILRYGDMPDCKS